MIQRRTKLTAVTAALLGFVGLILTGPAQAVGVEVALTNNGVIGDNTTLFSANLGGLALSRIGAITLTDSNSGTGGSGGAFSGFDLDAVFLRTSDGTQINPTSIIFNAGAIRGGGSGPTQGATSATMIDSAIATLSVFDADDGVPNLSTVNGFLSLGDGGMLTLVFGAQVAITPDLTLFIGEVNLANGESVSVHVMETPLPASLWFFLSALFVLVGITARRRNSPTA